MVRAKRSLGQNFLVDTNIQRRIVEAVEAGGDDTVLEIGPGTGALTRHLAGHVRRLVAVELDNELAPALERLFADEPTVEIVHADAMEADLNELAGRAMSLRVVGNIPYNITTPLLFRLLDMDPRPSAIVLMIQKEVADRILAAPGGKEYGALSAGVRAVADVQRLFNVGQRSFWPVPDVVSTVIRLTPFDPPRLTRAEEVDLRALTRTAFSWRRKQLQKILRSSPEYGLAGEQVAALAAETGLDLEGRPESLAPEQLVALSRALRARDLPASPRDEPRPSRQSADRARPQPSSADGAA